MSTIHSRKNFPIPTVLFTENPTNWEFTMLQIAAFNSLMTLDAYINTLTLRQNGQHFADIIFKCIFSNGNVGISIKFSLKFVPQGLINKIPALVQIMAWRHPGDKPLSEPKLISLLTHICVAQPQWVNKLIVLPLVQVNNYLNQWWLIVN